MGWSPKCWILWANGHPIGLWAATSFRKKKSSANKGSCQAGFHHVFMSLPGLLPSTQLSREHRQLLKALASFAKSAARTACRAKAIVDVPVRISRLDFCRVDVLSSVLRCPRLTLTYTASICDLMMFQPNQALKIWPCATLWCDPHMWQFFAWKHVYSKAPGSPMIGVGTSMHFNTAAVVFHFTFT